MNHKDTPKAKRRNTEMEFSPVDPKQSDSLDTEALRAILDEKLTDHITPLKAQIDNMQKALDNQKTATQRAVGSIKEDYLALKKENEVLHKKLTKLEFYQCQNNMKIYGILEEKGENVDAKKL